MKIKTTAFSVGLWSDDYKTLAKWYQNTLKLTPSLTANLPDDSFIAFKFGKGYFWIGKHDKVKGKNKDPYRIMIEFYVESVSEAYEELKSKNIEFIADPFPDPLDEDGWCMTCKDPEGNILQMYGKK